MHGLTLRKKKCLMIEIDYLVLKDALADQLYFSALTLQNNKRLTEYLFEDLRLSTHTVNNK